MDHQAMQSLSSRSRLVKILVPGALVVCVLLFAYAVWPTPYTYLVMEMEGHRFPVRVNRLTHTTEVFWSDGGWETVGREGHSLPAEAVDKIEFGKAQIDARDFVHIEVYNGSEYTIGSILIRIKVEQRERNVIHRESLPETAGGPIAIERESLPARRGEPLAIVKIRQYALTGIIPPYGSKTLEARTDIELDIDQSCCWSVVDVKGYKP